MVNKLSLNVKKTKAMIFHMPHKKIQLPLLQVAESNIEYVDNLNFVGSVHSEPLFKKLYLLKLDDIYRIQLLKFIYKLINKQLPDYFNQNLLLYNTQHHQHATRACINVFLPRVNLNSPKETSASA